MALSGPISAAAGVTGNKDLVQAYQPLLIAVITWFNPDGVTLATNPTGQANPLRLCTHPLNAAEGGVPYAGNNYQARLLDENIDAVAAMSDTGIDIPPTLTLKMADADRLLWLNYETPLGFKGAQLVVYQILYEVGTANFSSDIYIKFKGTCNPGTIDDESTLTVSAGSKLNMQKVLLPQIPVQQRCPWTFPANNGQRQQARANSDSPYFQCGYSPDIAGGKGSTTTANATDPLSRHVLPDAAGNFVMCGYAKTDCQARGMYHTDSSSRATGSFGGVQWVPPLWWKSKSYLQGITISGINSDNENKYMDYVPMIYGTTFVDPIVLNVVGDANSTRMEVLCGSGGIGNGGAGLSLTGGKDPGGVQFVIVNDVAVPFNYGNPTDPLFRWNWSNDGRKTSLGPQGDAGYNGLGDPYGNLIVLEIVVPKALADSQTVPGVKVLFTAPPIRVYTTPSVFSSVSTSNPVWILMDLLVQSNWTYSELNIQSFIDAAAVCDVPIQYINNSGGIGTHARYSCSLAVHARRSAADVVRGVRNSCKAMLIPNDVNGLLQVFIKGTMADQQPAAIPGSNNGTGVASINAAGAAATGFSAYDFDESSILENSDGSSSLTISQRTILNSPNHISCNFEDKDNQYVQDSVTEVDPVDIGRAGQEVISSIPADGINSYDQARRIFEGTFAETYRGNPRGDSGGTMVLTFQTTQKVSHLHVGQICRFSHQQLFPSQSPRPMRVIALQPAKDMETAKVTLQWHSDIWYTDVYGQVNDPVYSQGGLTTLARPPYAWQPSQEQPLVSDLIFPNQTNFTFGFYLNYATLPSADGTPIPQLSVSGLKPVNSFSGTSLQPPLIQLQGTHTPGGGTIAGGQVIYAYVCPYTAGPPIRLGPPTYYPCVIDIPAADANNSVQIATTSWPAPTPDGYYVFGGPDPKMPTFQGTAAFPVVAGKPVPPASITFSKVNVREYGCPDIMFDHIELLVKRQIHGGCWGQQISTVTATTLQFLGSTFGVNQWAGYDLSIIGRMGITTSLPVWNLRILSNTADTLTVALNTPNLTTLPCADPVKGIHVGDVAVMRARPSVFTALTIGDANFVNNISGGTASAGLAVNEGNYVLRIFAGTGAGQWRTVVSNTATVYTVDRAFDVIPDATSRFWIEDANAVTFAKSSVGQNQDIQGFYTGTVEIKNYNALSIVCQVLTVDSQGNASFEQDAPVRDMYVYGQAGSVINSTLTIAFNV